MRPPNLNKPDTRDVAIRDLRGHSKEELDKLGLNFDNAGFQLVQGWGPGGEKTAAQWADQAWDDEKWIIDNYYPYIESFLKHTMYPDAKVIVWDHTLRKRVARPEQDYESIPAEVSLQTHIDQTYWAAKERIRMYYGQETCDRVSAGEARAIICNVWRPLRGPVVERPLAAADRRTIDPERDMNMTLPAPPGCRTGESQMLRHHPDQKWYYVSKMQPDECLLLKIFDSKVGLGTPHSAFRDPNTPPDALPRWSMEVRTVILI
ncbi:hypothetical protein BDV93DRAFT_589925 [Ceratobasidium sp. AG-I]|nr:hypothetical protein BDV93DRAFT_589925 [Ceratobasidium sp. AG-I]